jgi:hypothetical protein
MRELLARRTEDGWEVCDGDEVFGRVGDPRESAAVECVVQRGRWVFRRLRGVECEATMGTAVVARYESKALTSGAIVLPDDSRLRLRRPVTGDVWRLRRGRRELVLEVRPLRVGWAIGLGPVAGEIQQLPLIAMFAFHAVLCELDVPNSGGVATPNIFP